MFVTGTLWFVLPSQMVWWDKTFVKGNGYGAAPFVAQFNNTLPSTMGRACTISPGPWKVRNYPNPFAEITVFEYTLSYTDIVTFEIYSMSGQLVQTLFSTKPHESGKYEMVFNSNLSAGAYIAMLKGTGIVATCKFVIVKEKKKKIEDQFVL
jgi:hypothetical protein